MRRGIRIWRATIASPTMSVTPTMVSSGPVNAHDSGAFGISGQRNNTNVARTITVVSRLSAPSSAVPPGTRNGRFAAPSLGRNVQTAGNEQELLGIAVDPGWPARPYVYVHYDQAATNKVWISRYTVEKFVEGAP